MKKELISKEEHADNLELLKSSGKIAQSSVARFSTIAESLAGKILSDDGINIAQALKENAIILFVLNPMVYPELSPAFGRLALIESKIAIGELYKTRVPRTFFIFDEISTYASPVLTDILGKSRSANVLCILAAQSLSDLDFAVNQAFKEQIIENCNNFLTMRQNSGINAEYLANLIGTRETMEVTHQLQQHGLDTSVTGYGSARRVREYHYHCGTNNSYNNRRKNVYSYRDCFIIITIYTHIASFRRLPYIKKDNYCWLLIPKQNFYLLLVQ